MPAKTATDETSPYAINRPLFEEAATIKEKVKLVETRLEKMQEHRTDVSESVFLKVRTDYEIQLDSVRESFQEKSKEIENELRTLYAAQEEQDSSMSRHQEILEEAKFRHTLGEYTDKKFKDLESVQTKEIKKFSDLLDIIRGSIKQYEDILGYDFKPGTPAPKPEAKLAPKPTPSPAPKAEKKTSTDKSAPKPAEEDTLKSLGVAEETRAGFVSPPPPMAAPSPDRSTKSAEEKLGDDLDIFLQSEGDYFTSEPEGGFAPEGLETKEASAPEAPAPMPAVGKGLDDSLSSILKDIPFDEEPSEVVSKPVTEETGAKLDMSAFPVEASLILIEGDLDENEFILAENTSIGRSPSNDIVLKETKVSRQHAAINFRDGHYVMVDLKSSNGVFINGKRVDEATLKDGDELEIGSFKFQFNLV